MKKRITFAIVMLAVLVCAFAISVSASDRATVSYTDANGTTHNVPIVKFDDATLEDVKAAMPDAVSLNTLKHFQDDSAYTVLKAKDGTLTAYPTWYLVVPSGGDESYIAVSEIRYQYVNGKQSKVYENGAVLYMELPQGVTHLRNNGVFGRGTHYEVNITELVVPSSVYEIQSGAFSLNTSLKTVRIEEGSMINKIGDDAFANCSALEYFDFDKLTHLTSIDGFHNTAITGTVDLSKNTSLEEIANNCFNSCKLTTVKLPDSVKYFRNGCFRYCGMSEFTFPASLERIENDVFEGNPNVVFSSGILPKNLNYIGVNFLYGCTKLPETIVFPVGVTSIPDEGFANVTRPNGNGNLNLVFLGKLTTLVIDGSPYQNWAEHVTVYLAQNTISDFTGNVYSYTNKTEGTLGDSVAQTGSLVLDVSDRSVNSTQQVGDNFIELIFCGNSGTVEQSYILTTNGNSITEDRGLFDMEGHTHHAYSAIDGDCTADRICIVCDVNFAQTTHNYKLDITYANGFLMPGVKSQACQNSGCSVAENSIEVDAIFKSLGVSVSTYADENGNYSVTQGFYIDLTAYKEYVNSGNSLAYGIVASSKNVTGTKPLTVEDGAVKAVNEVKTIFVPQNELLHDYIDVKVTGITVANNGVELIMCLFAFDGASISYISNGIQAQEAEAVAVNIPQA